MPSRRALLNILGSAALVGTTGCLSSGNTVFSPGNDATTTWPMARHDPGNTAFAPDAKAPRTSSRKRWSLTSVFDVRTPAIVGGTVFAPAASGLLALDSQSGERRWRFAPTEQPWPSPPTVQDGIVYVKMVDDDTLHAVDVNTGTEQWSLTDVGSVTTPPHLVAGQLVENPRILVGGENGTVRALHPATGEEHWQLDIFGGITTIAYDSRGLYVGTTSGEVYSYLPEGDTGRPQERWRKKIGSQIESIIPTDNGVIVTTFGGPVQNLKDGAHAGTTDWTAPDRHAGSPPVYAGSWIYSAGWKSLSSLRVYDKNLHWRVGGEFGNAGPVAAGDTLYVPGKSTIHAFDLAGGIGAGGITFAAKRWSRPIDSGGIQGLAIGDGALFVACEAHDTDDTSLICLEPGN